MSSNIDMRPVSTPFVRRIALIRQKFLPLVAWVSAIAALAFMTGRHGDYVTATGMAEARAVSLAPTEGTVQSLSVDLLDDVEAGEVVALMDDTLIVAELRVAEAELAAQRAALEFERRRLELDHADARAGVEDDIRRFIIDHENARLDYLDRLIEQETNKVRVQRLAVQLNRYEKLLEDRLVDEFVYDETRLEHDSLRTQIEESEASLALASERRDAAAARLAEARNLEVPESNTEEFLAHVGAAIAAQEATIAEIKSRRMKLALKAPITGRVSQLNYRPGETIIAGTPLLTITDTETSRVIAYLEPSTPRLPQVGDNVEVISQRTPSEKIPARVLRVGRSVELMPEHLWANTITPTRGIPVLLGTVAGQSRQQSEADGESRLLPGEVVNVRVGLGSGQEMAAQTPAP